LTSKLSGILTVNFFIRYSNYKYEGKPPGLTSAATLRSQILSEKLDFEQGLNERLKQGG